MSEETRRRWRRRLLVAGLAPLLVALALTGKVAVMLVLDRDGRSDYRAGEFAAAQDAFAGNATLNLFEPWVSPFDEGTARYQRSDFTGAVHSLEEALETVPPDEECRVRVNLSLAHESVGDAALAGADLAAARASWQLGVEVLAEGGCLAQGAPIEGASIDGADGAGSAAAGSASAAQARDARSVDTRLRDKLRQAGATDLEDPAAAGEDPARLEQLEERNEEGERLKQEAEERQQDREDREDPSDQQDPSDPEDSEDTVDDPPVYEW